MEIECDLASIRDEDLLRKMWQQSEDFGRKKEIRSHLYKLRESRLREFYSSGGPGGEIMNPSTDLHFGKTPLTPSHGDSLVDQSFQSLKSKEIRDSLSPTHEVKFRNSGGVAGGVLVPDTTGWDVQTSSEVSPDGRAFRTETLAKTDGVEKLPGGHAEFSGRNEQKSSASHQGDDKNYVKKAAESSKTHLQEKVVIGDENSGRTEMKSSSVTSSSKVTSSSSQQVFTSDDPGFDMEPRRLTQQHDQRYQNMLQAANNSSTLHSERQQFSRNERNERQESTSNLHEENKKYVDMDKASPEYQQHVQYLMSQPGAIVSNTVEYPKPGVKMITTVKKLPDGTTVKTKRYETEATAANTGADSTSISHTTKQQQQQKISSSSTTSQKMTEKRVQDSEDVFTRLARTRDSNVPPSPRNAPETPSNEDVYSRLQQSRDHKFSDSLDQRSTQILRDTNQQHPGSRNAPIRRPSDLVENVEMISTTNKTVKKDLNRSEKITSSDFIQNERDRYVLDQDSPNRRGPDGYPEALVPITPSRHGGRPSQPGDDYPTNGYNATEVIKQSSSSKSSAKFSESRRYSTETVESYQHSENENQDYTTRGYPSNRRPIDEPKGQSPRPGGDFSTHGFPSVRSDKPISDRSRPHDDITERVHIVHTDRGDVNHSDTTTTRSNYSTNETRRHVTKEDFSTHGFPSVRAGTPTRDSPRRPLGSEPSPGESPRRPSGQEPPAHQVRRPPSDGYSTHGFPSVKSGSPTEDSPRRPSGTEPTNQGRRPTTEDFSTHGFPSVKPAGRSSTPTQSSPQYDSPNRVDRDDTASVTSDRSNSIIYEKKIDAAHQAFARSLRCASPVEPVRRDSTDRTPRSSIGSIRNTYSPSKRDTRSPSHDSVTNSESSRISSATVTKSTRPTEVRRVSHPKSPIGKSSPSHVSNETIDLTLTRKITAKPSPDKTTGSKPSPVIEEPIIVAEPILMRKKIFGATENFLASEGVIEKPILKKQPYYQLGLSDATLPSSYSKSRQGHGTTPNTSRRVHQQQYNNTTEEEVNTLLDTATKHITNTHSSITPTTTTRSLRPQDTKPKQPETLYSKKPLNKPEGYITLNEANEINEKHNQTTNKHVSYPNYIPSGPKADRSPSTDRPTTTTTTNNLSSPAPITTTSTTPHNAPKTTKDKVKPSSSTTTTSPTTKPFTSPSKVDNSTSSRFTKTVKVENAINRDTTTKTKRQPKLEPESDLETSEPLREPEDLDEGYVPDRKGKKKPNSQRPTSDDEGFEPDSPRAGSPTSDFEYRRPEQVETYDEEDSYRKKTSRTDKKVVTNDFLNTERNVTETRRTPVDEPKRPKDREGPKRPGQDDKPSYKGDTPKGPDDQEPKRPQRRPKDEDTEPLSYSRDRKPSQLVDEPGKKTGPSDEPSDTEETTRRPSYQKEPSDKPSRPTETSRPRGTKPPLERSETFEDRCRQILGIDSETVVDRTKKTEEFIETERTTVDSKRRPSGRSPSPTRKQPSDTVSIEDCDDDDLEPERRYPNKTTTTTTTVKTTREQPRDKSPSKKGPGDHPRDESPDGKVPKSTTTNKYDETTTTTLTTKITDGRSPSPKRKSPKDGEDDTRPRGRSPSDRPGRIDGTTTIKETTKIVDEIDERSTRTKPGDKSPKETRPREKSPSDTVSIEDCDDDDDDSPRKYPTNKTTKTTTTVTTTRGQPRDKSPIEKKPNKPRDQSPVDRLPKGTTTNKYDVKTTVVTTTKVTDDRSPSPKRKSPKDTNPEDIRPRGRSPSERPNKVDETTTVRKTSKIVDEIDEQTTRSKPGSKPRDRFPSGTRPKEHWPSDDSETDSRPRERSPSEKGTYFTTRETTFDVETSSQKSPLRKPGRETSPTDESPRDRSPNKKPVRGTSPTDKSPRDRSPTSKPVRGTSPTDKSPLGESPFRQPVRGTSPTDESPRGRSPTKKPISSPTDKSPHGRSPTDETIIFTTTTTHSTTTDGVIEDRYPSYTPRSYPRDRSPVDKQKPKPKTTEEEELVIETSKKTKKTTTEEIHDDVFETKKPCEKQPDTRDGAYFSQPRDQSPSEPGTYRPRTDEEPRDRSPVKPTTKETDELITKRTTKTTKDTTTESEFTSPRPKDSPRDRSPSKKPLTEDVTECTPSSRPKTYPRDQSPVDDLTRPREITETRRVDKTIVINDFLDTEMGVDRPQRPKEDKPYDGKTPERLTSSQPNKDSPIQKPKGPKDVDETTIIKTTKITKDTTVDREVEELFPSNRPRDRSPTEKPIRSPRIVTTETTTEYGITSRPRSQSPSEKPRKPVDSEDIDETYIQKTTKITEDTTITTDLDEDIVKPSRRPRPSGTKDQPREKSPQKSKPSDRSPSPRSKYPRDQKPKTEDRSPVGKQPRTTDKSTRRTSPVKPTTYQSTDEETNLVKKTKTTKVTTTSRDVEDVDFEDRPRDRSPIEKPRGFRPINGDQSPRDRLRGPSPAKKPEDREPIDSDYDETVVKRTNKTTRNETTLEEITDLSSKTYPEDKPRDKSPSKPRGQRPTDDRSPKSPRGTSPSEKPRRRDRSPTEKPRRPLLDEETIVQTTSIKTTTLEDQSPKRSRETSPSRDYPRDRSPSGKARKPGMIDEIYVESTTTESTTIKDRLSKSPRGTSPSEKPGPRDYPRDRSPSDKPRNTKLYDDETVVQTTTTTVKDRVTKSPRGSSPSEKPGPRDYPRDRSPSDKPRRTKLYDDETVVETTTTTVKDRLTKGPRGTSPSEKPGSRDYPRDRSPSDKPRKTKLYDDETVVETTTTTVKDRLTKSPRGTSPTEKPRPKDYPRDNSPNDKPRKTRLYDETVVEKTTTESTTVKDRLTKSPRGTSPTEKPRPRESPRDRSPTDKNRPRGLSPTEKPSRRRPVEEKPDETFVRKTTRERKTVEETTDEYVDDCCPEHHPRVKSPLRKPKETKPVGETVVKRTVKTTTVDDHTTKTTPRGSSPTKTSPRERSPTQKPGYERSPKDSPRRTSPSEKPTRRQPIVTEVGKSVQKITSKFSKDIKTSEKVIVKDHPRRKSPSEKPRRLRPTNDEETDDDDETTETIIAVYTIDGETVESHPRDLSPSEKPKSSPRKPSGDSPNGPQTNGHHPRGISPTDKPQRRQPTDEEIEESFTSRTKITKERNTFEEVDRYPEAIQPRESSPTGKPRGRQPTDESIDITFVKKTSRTQKDENSLEETEYQYPEDRPRGRLPSDKPSFRVYPRDSSPTKPTEEDEKSPMRKPQVPQNSEETVLYTTKVTTRIEDHPRDRSPSDKPGPRSYPRDKSPIDKPSVRAHPSDKSPLDKPSRTRPSKLEETTNRSTTVRKTVQETDRYPKARAGDQSPNEKPSTLRRPSKLSSTTTTTTTRNRSTLDEQDITRTPQRPRTQPSTPGKVPTKSTPLSSQRSQPTSERRIPAELPSPVRKPKSTFGATTKTTTTTTTRSTGASPRPRPTTPKKPSKLPLETRPTARPVERKLSPSISPDSSPSRPGSDFEVDLPYRSPNMSPSRKSPSPTRSVKLEDITTTTTTKKTTLLTDKSSKPKVTHVTTAKFQITPPTSPNKVINSPEIKFSPSPKKPSSRVPTPKPNKFTSETTTTKKVTSKIYKDGLIPTDSERDSEVPTDAEEVDTPLQQKPSTRKLPVTERKESAPVHRVTKVNKDIQMSRSTSENIIKTPITKRPVRHEPMEPQREVPSSRPTVNDRSSPKTERRPSKHLSTKTINLTTFDKVINSEDMENVVIDIQHAKSSREPSPNKIVPTPVSVDMYTGKPRYPDVVQEPEDEPKKKPTVKNIPIFEEETNDFVGCQITEVSEETHENTVRARTTKFIEKESSPQRQTPRIVTGDNVDSECLLSVHDKVSKFISTAEEVSKPKTSAPFRRDVPEKDMPEDDECLLTVDEKVSKFLKTADSVTKEVITSKPRRVERPSIEDLDEDLKTDECVLSVSEKVNKFTTKAEKLAPSAPQRSPELVARIERQISRQSDVESEGPESEDSPPSVRKFKPSSPLTERTERKYTERQIDILSRPSVWEKKPKPDVKLDDIFGYKPENEPRNETYPDEEKSKPVKTTGSVSKRKELFENKVSTNKTTTTTKQSSPEKRPSSPSKSPSGRRPSDDSNSRYPNEFVPRYVDGYPNQHPDDDVHEDVYGSSKTRRVYETSSRETTTIHRSPERSPTRKSSHPEIRPLPTTNKSPRQQQQPEDKTTPSRRYSEDHSPRYPTRDQPSADRYMETREASEHTTRRRSSTQEYPERRTPYTNGSPSQSSLRKQQQQPVEEPEDYTFSSKRDETTTHHHTTRTAPRSPKDSPLTPNSFLDDEDHDHSPARSTSTVSSHKQVTTSRTSMTKRLTEDTSRRPRRPSGNEPTTPTSTGRTPRSRAVPETVAARRNIFEKTPGDISPMPSGRRPSYMEPTKSSLEHRKDSLEITKTNFSRKSSMEEEPYEPSPRTSVKFGVGLKHKEEPKPKRKLSSSDIPNIEDVFELELLEEMLNIVTLYEQRRRIRAQIRVVKKLLETKTKEEVSRMTKISTIRKTSSSSVRESPTPKRESRPERYQPTDDDIDSESIIESRHVEEHEEIIRERSISPQTKTSRIVTKVTEVRKIAEPSSTPNKRTPLKTKDEPKESKPIWATKNILKKPSENEKVTRALSAKKTTSTSSSSMSRTQQQTHRQRVSTDDDCVTSSYGIGPTDEDGRPLFGIRALKKKTTTNNNTVQPSETTKVTGTVITEKYYSENGAEPVGERKVTVYSTNPEDLVDLETQYDRRDSETVKREKLSKDGVTTVTKVQKIGKYKPGEIPSLTDDAEFSKSSSKMVRRGSVKEMSEKFIRKESSSSVTEKSSSGYPKAGLILRTRTNSGATADTADQYEVRGKSTEYDYESEDDVEIRTSRKHSKVVTESEDETEIRRKVNTRSFLNSGGSKVTGVDDVLDRMRNADNVVVDGDTMEDREARSLLNKFLGASVLMSGMESMIPQMELRKSTAGADNKQEVKTTRVTKTIKTGTTGGSSSSPVARETCDFEEIWDEETLKQLLEKSTSYEERRSIRARLRQLMADREACAESKASAKAELNETKVKTSTKATVAAPVEDDESSGSEYEEIIEEYTASEDDQDEETTTTTTTTTKTVIPDKKKIEVKEDKNTKQITEEIKKTTITKKEEPKSSNSESKKTVIVETTTVIEEVDDDDDDEDEDDTSSPSNVDEKKVANANKKEDVKDNKDGGDSDSVSDSKGESLLIPLLQGLLHKNMPQARSSSSSGSSSKNTTTTNATTSTHQNSNNLKSSLKANNTHFSSTSKSNNNNSLGDSGLSSSEVSKNTNSSLGQPKQQQQNGSSLRVPAIQQIEDSGTESGEDLRLIAAGIRDSMQIEGIENHSDMSLIKEVTNALNKLESSLKEGKDLALDSSKKSTLLALVERLQTGLTAPDKLSSGGGEQDFPDETSSPEADNHRSNRQRFAKRKNRNNRHTVGVSKEELADARRYMEEMVMIENLSNCTTPDCSSATTPPELFAIQKQNSSGAILTHEPQETSASLFRPNQFVPNNLKHSTEAGSNHSEVQMRQKKGTPGPGQRQSTGDMDSIRVPNSDSNNGKRPLSDSFDAYTAQNNRVTFNEPDNSVQEKNQYNRSHHSDEKPNNNPGRLSPDSNRFNRFNNKKQLMKRANTIDIPKTHRYNPEFDTDSDFEERSALKTKGLKGTVQVNVKRKPRQVVPNFEPKTENDHKFLAFIQKQSTTTGLGWNSSKSVSNWTNKFGNIKNVFESGANVTSSNGPKTSGPASQSSAKNFWKKSEEQNPPKTSTSVLTSALKAKERNEKRGEVVVPKPIHLNQFSHNPQSAFRPVDTSPETIQMQFKPIPMEKPLNVPSNVVNNSLSPTKAYNPVRKQVLESPHYSQSSPTKSWIKKNTATNSPVTLPWTAKPPDNNVLKIAAKKFESKSPVQRHQSFKQQEKRPSLPNTAYPYQYQDYGHSQQSYVSNSSQPTSYADYTPQPRIFRESSLTNPQAEPLILTSNAPAYSPHSLQPYEYYEDDMNQNIPQTDMTDDDIDDMESMTEYRVEAKVMGKPLSQQAVTVGNRTSHMSDDEVFGKNSKAAKNLLSVMKNIGSSKPAQRTPKKSEPKKQPPSSPATCMSPNGSAYQAPIVEPLFPEVTKFEANRDPEYIKPQPNVGYHQNPVYIPLEDYQQKEPPVAPPRGRKVSQEIKKKSAYVPKERPNQEPSRRDAPNSLPIQAGPTSPPRYVYSSPIKSPDSSSAQTAQVLSEGMYMQNVPAFRKPYSEPNTPNEYSSSNEAYFNQYGEKIYARPQPPVILPQIPLETSYTKVYDKPRDIAPFYQVPVEQPIGSGFIQSSPQIQPKPQQTMYIPPEYQQQAEIPQQYYQSPKIQQSPLPQGYVPQQVYQPRTEISPEYYQSPKIQQSPQPSTFIPQQTYQPRVDVSQEYYQLPRTQQISQPQGLIQESVKSPSGYYQSPPIQPSQQPKMLPQQHADIPTQYVQSPRVPQSPRSDVPPSYYHSPKVQQSPQQPTFSPQISEIPLQYPQSPKVLQTKPSTPQQVYKSPIIRQSPQTEPQNYTTTKTQQSQQPMSPIYKPRAPMIQSKPQVPPKNESVIQSTKTQHSSSSYRQQQVQSIVAPIPRPVEPEAPNAAVLCKQASLEGRNRVQSQSQKYEQVEEIRRKSLGNVLEVTRVEREAREQKAAAIKQDMYSVQQDVYSQQKSVQKTEVHQQESKVVYKSSAPDDTPDIVKSSLKKDDIPILKKFGPPQRHCYMPNAYQSPLMKSETTVNMAPKTVSRKFSDPAVTRSPLIVEIPATPQPSEDEIPRNIVFNNISAFTSMSRKQAETSTEYTSGYQQQNRPNKLSKCDSWHQICQLQNIPKPPSPKFNTNGNAALRRSKSGHTLALPKLYEATYDRAEISEKQKTVAAYFGGQKSPNSLSRNSSQTNLAEESNYVAVKKSSINRIKTSEKASISRQDPSSGLSRSHTMPQIANINLLDESNVEDAFEQLMNGQSTTTTEKTETKKEDGGVVTTTTKVTTRTITGAPKPVSPFAKFQQLDKQNSLQSPKSPLTPTTPGGSSTTPIFKFTDPALNARAATFKEQLLQWCQSKTQEYENVQITNFSASWTDGLAFCALIHHFLPDAFDYSKLNPKQRRYNFELAFRVADEKAGIAPLLDVEDMVVMKRPDWKCVFTYVQSIYRRFRNCQ